VHQPCRKASTSDWSYVLDGEPNGRKTYPDRIHCVLRARAERPSSRRAAEQRDELAALHSITSSARALPDCYSDRDSGFNRRSS
jgi:hypothetical protein